MSAVGTRAAIGSVAGLSGIFIGAAIGGAITYFSNRKIEQFVAGTADLISYEINEGRDLYFKCPKCGHE